MSNLPSYAELRSVSQDYTRLSRNRAMLMGHSSQIQITVTFRGMPLDVPESYLSDLRQRIVKDKREQSDQVRKNLEARGYEVPPNIRAPSAPGRLL